MSSVIDIRDNIFAAKARLIEIEVAANQADAVIPTARGLKEKPS
jgi:hypothetical protein